MTIAGVFAGSIAIVTALIELGTRRRWRSPTVAALVLEGLLVAAFMVYGSRLLRNGTIPGHAVGGYYALLTLAGCAMGTQAATVTKWGRRTIRTTYMSGMITRFAQNVVDALARPARDGEPSYLRDHLGLEGRRDSARACAVYLGLWGAFLGGGVLGAWGELRFGLWALAFPLGGLVLAAVADLRRPVYGVRRTHDGA